MAAAAGPTILAGRAGGTARPGGHPGGGAGSPAMILPLAGWLAGWSVAGALAAVDVQDLSSHELGGLQIRDRFDDVADVAHPADRMQRGERVVGLLGVHRSADDARRHRVDAHAASRVLD